MLSPQSESLTMRQEVHNHITMVMCHNRTFRGKSTLPMMGPTAAGREGVFMDKLVFSEETLISKTESQAPT